MPGSFCTVCRKRISKGSRCGRHMVRSPSNRAWHEPGAGKVRENLLAQGACRVCGSTDRLELHHVVAARDGGPTTPGNLAVLCHAHHLAVERGEISLGLVLVELAERPLAAGDDR